MIRTKEDKKKVDTAVLERYFTQYKDLQQYTDNATEVEKQTQYYKHRLQIVKGIDKVYPTLKDEMKTIVQRRYWFKDYQTDWAELADELGMSVNKTRAYRDIIIQEFSEAIGWV